jgi:hypothetical protein
MSRSVAWAAALACAKVRVQGNVGDHARMRLREVVTMEEDVVGTMRTIGTPTYVECARCSKMTLAQKTVLLPSDARDGVSEYQQLCEDCYKALSDGEQELPPAEP